MKSTLLICLLIGILTTPVRAQSKLQHGTIVRMQMAECITAEHGFMAALSGASRTSTEGICPEYVLVADKVVYVIVGRSSTALVPLAETTKFRFQNNELLIRIDDARKESRFAIREMVLRSEWDRVHPHTMEAIDSTSSPHRINSAVLVGQDQ